MLCSRIRGSRLRSSALADVRIIESHPRRRRAWTSAPGTERRAWSTGLQEPRDIRRSVLEQLLQPGPFEACRTGSSVALVISGGYAAEFSGPELFRLVGRGLRAAGGTAARPRTGPLASVDGAPSVSLRTVAGWQDAAASGVDRVAR